MRIQPFKVFKYKLIITVICVVSLNLLPVRKSELLVVFFCVCILFMFWSPHGEYCRVNNLSIYVELASVTYGTRTTRSTPSNFWWHADAPRFTYRFCYDSHTRYLDLHFCKNTYVVGTLNDLKLLSRRIVSKRLSIPYIEKCSFPLRFM